MHRLFTRRRILGLALLFGLGVAVALHDWTRHPPVVGNDGGLLNMRNGPGDLAAVLEFYLVEFVVAAVALQPWRLRPRPVPVALTGLAFLVWDALDWLVGLHAPTVMLGHDVLMFIVACYLIATALLVASLGGSGASLDQHASSKLS